MAWLFGKAMFFRVFNTVRKTLKPRRRSVRLSVAIHTAPGPISGRFLVDQRPVFHARRDASYAPLGGACRDLQTALLPAYRSTFVQCSFFWVWTVTPSKN